MKFPVAAVLFVSACVGATSETPSIDSVVTASIADPVALQDWSMEPQGTGVVVDPTKDVDYIYGSYGAIVTLSFDGTGGVDLYFGDAPADGNYEYDDHLEWSESAGAYLSASGSGYTLYAYDNPDMPGVYVLKLIYEVQGETYSLNSYHVIGDQTPGANLPPAGRAIYTGTMEFTDTSANVADGAITLSVNFNNETLSGEFVMEAGTVIGAATFAIAETEIILGVDTADVENSTFSAAISSDDVAIRESEILGTFYGDEGEYIGGTVDIWVDDGVGIAGVYTASN